MLVATTIIENGLDIPLANTILISRADRHGLSELYRLRGRVGRSNRRAYAYLLIPPEQELTEIARRRLAALKEFPGTAFACPSDIRDPEQLAEAFRAAETALGQPRGSW